MDAAPSRPALTVNGRRYTWPAAPTVVVCLDGSAPDYVARARAAGAMPWLDGVLGRGTDRLADAVMPSFTNPNNLSIVTGVPPAVHGISGNFFLDRARGLEVMMNDPALLRAETILAAFARAGARVAVVTAKDKLRALLASGLPVAEGRAACFSAERAEATTAAEHGLGAAAAFVGRPQAEVYSAGLSEFVLAAGVRLMERWRPDLMYLSTTDYVQHKHAPGTAAAESFYRMVDAHLAALDAAGATVVLTADHGMSAKTDADGRPRVIWLQEVLDARFGAGRTRVILPITDPYVRHHGALGSFATVYLEAGTGLAEALAAIRAIAGVTLALSGAEGCRRFDLPPDRMGDVIVVSAADTVIGATPARHDLSGLDAPLRSHGGLAELAVPMLLNRPTPALPPERRLRNFDAFELGLNHALVDGRSPAP